MESGQTHTVRGILCATLGGICWGCAGTIAQYLFTVYPITPLQLTCFRMLTAAAILGVFSLLRYRNDLREMLRDRRTLLRLLIYGVFGLASSLFCYTTAIFYSNAATTTVLQNLNMVFIMLISCVQVRRPPSRREGIALILATVGAWLLATGGDFRHMVLTPAGLFWGLATAVAVTAYTLLPRPMLRRWSQYPVTALGMLFGGIVVNLGCRSWENVPALPLRAWGIMLSIVILGTVLATTLYLQGVADIGPFKSSMLAITEPVSAAILGAIWLHTSFSPADFAGFACIFVTILLLSTKGKTDPAE